MECTDKDNRDSFEEGRKREQLNLKEFKFETLFVIFKLRQTGQKLDLDWAAKVELFEHEDF